MALVTPVVDREHTEAVGSDDVASSGAPLGHQAPLGHRAPLQYRVPPAVPAFVVVGATLVAALCVGLLIGGGPTTTVVALGLVLMLVGAIVTVVYPRAIYRTLAFTLGAAPVMVVPGVPIPFVLAMVLVMWCAVLTHPVANTHISSMEVAVGLLIVASALSLIMTAGGTKAHFMEFAKWLIATSLLFAIMRLSRADRRVFARAYVYGAAGGAALALMLWKFDTGGTFMSKLAPIGYGNTGTIGTHLRFYESPTGNVVRLTGTYVDPNLAGIFLYVGLLLSVAVFRGGQRVVLSGILLVGVVVTLSRSAIFSLVVAIILLLLFQQMSSRLRLQVIIGGAVAAGIALSVPSIGARILTSFGSEDKGSQDRSVALERYLGYMHDKWWFGHGFGAREFTDEVVGWQVNYVANSPLLTIYRAGILAGIAFIAILVLGAVIAYRNMRRSPWESGVIGAGFVGFAIVALQLDFPVVTLAPVTMVFSVLLAMLVTNPIEQEDEKDVCTTDPGIRPGRDVGDPTGQEEPSRRT